MKVSLFTLVSFIFLSVTTFAQEKSFIIPANKAYAEPYTDSRRDVGVRIPVGYPEDKGSVWYWVNKERKVVWYLYQKQGNYQLQFERLVKKDHFLDFQLKVSGAYDELDFKTTRNKFTWEGSGKLEKSEALPVHIKKTGYYRYELTALNNPDNAIEIKNLVFNSSSKDAQVNQTDYQSSPSVHINFSSTEPTTRSYSWLYEQVEVPENADPLHTFYMAIGFYRGYFGIQTNSGSERRVLFSVWDNKDAENDEDMQDDDFVTLVDKDDNTTVNSFGGEGTGGQSYVSTADWETGKTVSFLMNVRPQDNHSVVLSAWYQLEGQNQWNYVASWRAPKEQRYFNGFHSFLENYGYGNGQKRRMAEYFNAFGYEHENKKWVNLNKVSFSHTDGDEGQRVDYEQGVSPLNKNRFYMSSGGYTPTVKTEKELPYSDDFPKLDLTVFEKRVDQALKNETKYKNKRNKEYSK